MWLDLGEALAVAAETGFRRVRLALRPKRKGSYHTRRPGYDTPMWNVCAKLLKAELKVRGSKVRLARYLGIPRQRLQDYLNGRSRMPDAELLLRLLHWLSGKRAGRDLSL
jgi:transcriptional regulator with XRE-family HTH domain